MGNKTIVNWIQFHCLTPENDDVNDISVKSSKKMFTWLPINPNWTRRTGQEDNP